MIEERTSIDSRNFFRRFPGENKYSSQINFFIVQNETRV